MISDDDREKHHRLMKRHLLGQMLISGAVVAGCIGLAVIYIVALVSRVLGAH